MSGRLCWQCHESPVLPGIGQEFCSGECEEAHEVRGALGRSCRGCGVLLTLREGTTYCSNKCLLKVYGEA